MLKDIFFNLRLFSILYIGFLSFLSVFIFFKIQETDYITRLNNHNLSQQSYLVEMPKKTKAEDLISKVNHYSNLSDVQLHFRSKKDPRVTYYYGKGDYSVPPMLSGDFFSDDDFTSNVAVAVVGKDLQSKLYEPKDQQYLRYHNRYLTVVGVMGDKYRSKLDKQIFISMSAPFAQKTLNSHYRIILDDSGKSKLTAKKLKKNLGAAKVRKYFVKKKHLITNQWVNSHLIEAVCLIVIVLAAFLEIAFWLIISKRSVANNELLNADSARIFFNQFMYFALFNGLGVILGTILGLFRFNLTSYTSVLTFNIALYIIVVFVFALFFRKLLRDGEENRL